MAKIQIDYPLQSMNDPLRDWLDDSDWVEANGLTARELKIGEVYYIIGLSEFYNAGEIAVFDQEDFNSKHRTKHILTTGDNILVVGGTKYDIPIFVPKGKKSTLHAMSVCIQFIHTTIPIAGYSFFDSKTKMFYPTRKTVTLQ